jgi:hypothetical protein
LTAARQAERARIPLPSERDSAVVRNAAPVVAVRLCGGLGNQLFQFAAGRSLAERCGAQLILDATVFTLPHERRTFALGVYPLDAKVTFDGYAYPPTWPVAKLPRPSGEDGNGLVDRILHKMGRSGGMIKSATTTAARGLRRLAGQPPGLHVLVEKSFDYDSAFAQARGQTYLEGYWQSERYFVGVRDVIRRELTLPYAPNAANREWLARIDAANAVCVHVRRGDYLTVDHFAQHGVCSAAYFARAMRLVRERVENPTFFIFSDDLAWCRQHVAGANVAYVDANPPEAAHDELKLMSACRHHIIANSSLSWWGAWLARHDGQIVIGPDPWFSARKATPDLFPAEWLALPRD